MGLYEPATVGDPNAIRRFSDLGIESAMKKQLANLERGKRGAVVMYLDSETETVNGAIYGRKPGRFFGLLPPGEWSYVLTGGTTFEGELHGGAAVAYSW